MYFWRVGGGQNPVVEPKNQAHNKPAMGTGIKKSCTPRGAGVILPDSRSVMVVPMAKQMEAWCRGGMGGALNQQTNPGPIHSSCYFMAGGHTG